MPSTQSEQMVNGNPTVVNKSLWPAINYWLALTTPNGAPANPLIVHRALLKFGVAVTANQVSYARMINGIGHYRNVTGLGKSVVVFRLFEKLRYSNERSTIF